MSLGERFPLESSGRRVLRRSFRPGAHWNLPNLRNVTLHNVYATTIPWRSCAQIESLVIGITGVQLGFITHIYSMRELAAVTSLTSLRLSLNGCCFKTYPSRIAVLRSVKSLHIEILCCTQSPEYQYALWHEFCKLHFPSVAELSFVFDFGNEDGDTLVRWDGYNTALHSFLTTDLVNEYRYISLSTLDVSILSTIGPGV